MSCSLTLLNALSAAARTYDLLGVQDRMEGFLGLLERQTGAVALPRAEGGRLSRINHQSYEGADARWRKENLEPGVRETIERNTPCDAFLYGVAKGWFEDDAVGVGGGEGGEGGEGGGDGGDGGEERRRGRRRKRALLAAYAGGGEEEEGGREDWGRGSGGEEGAALRSTIG